MPERVRRVHEREHDVHDDADENRVRHRPDPEPLAQWPPPTSTTTPTMIAHVPTPSPNVRESPWCSTSHGSSPSPASTSIDAVTPYRTSPSEQLRATTDAPVRWDRLKQPLQPTGQLRGADSPVSDAAGSGAPGRARPAPARSARVRPTRGRRGRGGLGLLLAPELVDRLARLLTELGDPLRVAALRLPVDRHPDDADGVVDLIAVLD